MREEELARWFEGVFAVRDEEVYPTLFGGRSEGIFHLTREMFASLGCEEPDPRFLTHGVFECGPVAGQAGEGGRDHYVYVTSGMSNPWGETPETVNVRRPSGLGVEFTLHTRERAGWAVKVLHWVMAVQLLTATGQLEGELLQANDRVPLGGTLGSREGLLTHLLVAAPDVGGGEALYPPGFVLPSGTVELLVLVGITGKENDFARVQGVEGLVTLLRHRGVWPLTEVGRVGVV